MNILLNDVTLRVAADGDTQLADFVAGDLQDGVPPSDCALAVLRPNRSDKEVSLLSLALEPQFFPIRKSYRSSTGIFAATAGRALNV